MLSAIRFKLFSPILAGATLRDRLLACCGALVGICLTGFFSTLISAHDLHMLLLVPPMGASAVLLFAVPASPMAQPWPTIGGNVVSALVGITVSRVLPEPALAAGVAVALAIGLMSLLRCLHPPGGAAALVAVFAGSSAGLLFPLVPVGLNAVVLVACGWLYHRFSGHSYPHVAVPALKSASGKAAPEPLSEEDIEAALADLGETFDISNDDIRRLLNEIEKRSIARTYRDLSCAEIMAQPVVSIRAGAKPKAARDLLIQHDFRVLPVLDDGGRVVGSISHRDLVHPASSVREIMAPPATALAGSHALDLIHLFANGGVHAVFIVDDRQQLLGVITEADWLSVLTKRVLSNVTDDGGEKQPALSPG